MASKPILKETPRRLLRRFKVALKEAKIPFDKMILFGSRARGEARPWSDIDVCVVSKAFGKDRFSDRVKLSLIAADIEPLIEPVGLHPRELRDPWDSLAAAIREDGVTVE